MDDYNLNALAEKATNYAIRHGLTYGEALQRVFEIENEKEQYAKREQDEMAERQRIIENEQMDSFIDDEVQRYVDEAGKNLKPIGFNELKTLQNKLVKKYKATSAREVKRYSQSISYDFVKVCNDYTL